TRFTGVGYVKANTAVELAGLHIAEFREEQCEVQLRRATRQNKLAAQLVVFHLFIFKLKGPCDGVTGVIGIVYSWIRVGVGAHVKTAGFKASGIAGINHVGVIQVVLEYERWSKARLVAIAFDEVIRLYVKATPECVIQVGRRALGQYLIGWCYMVLVTGSLFGFARIASPQNHP